MSFLRFASPHHPTILIDQGPAAHHRARSSVGGELVTPQKAPPRLIPATTEARRKQIAEYAYRIKNPCGKALRNGVCAAGKGHAGGHDTLDAMKARAARRRAEFAKPISITGVRR